MRIKFILPLLLALPVLFFSCGKQETALPQKRDITETVFASGKIEYENEYLVTAVAEGFIRTKSIREGDSVQAGAPLFTLSAEVQTLQSASALTNYEEAVNNASQNSPKIQQVTRQIEQARQANELDRKNLERYETLIKTQAVSRMEYDRVKLQYENSKLNVEIFEKNLSDLKNSLSLGVENARYQLGIQQKFSGDYFISASTGGITLDVYKQTGELVRKGEALARIGSGKLITRLYIAEEDINKIRTGQKVALSLNTEKAQTFEATVSRIYPAFDERQQSFVIEVEFSRQVPLLRSGTQVQANIITGQRQGVLVISPQFILPGNKVQLSSGEEIKIETGLRGPDWVEITKGLNPGTEIILNKK